jgi:hypothetical protein
MLYSGKTLFRITEMSVLLTELLGRYENIQLFLRLGMGVAVTVMPLFSDAPTGS